MRTNQRVAETLIARTKRTLTESGFPVYRVAEAEQRGRSFGERITHAIADVFAAGHEHVIVLGNDCPQLSVAHLNTAARLLREERDVIGPDGRGGAWMIGLRRSDFDAATFAGLAWKTENLLKELQAYCSSPALLEVLRDVNTLADFRELVGWEWAPKLLVSVRRSLLSIDAATVRQGRAPPVALPV